MDDQFVYYTTGGIDPKIKRIRLVDHKLEDIASLKNLPRALGSGGYTYLSVAPDGSPIFTRDISTQEIYALNTCVRRGLWGLDSGAKITLCVIVARTLTGDAVDRNYMSE